MTISPYEPHHPSPPAVGDPESLALALEGAAAAVRMAHAAAQDVADLRGEVAALKFTATQDTEHMELLGFLRTYKVRYRDGARVPTDVETLSSLGIKVSQWCESLGIYYKKKGGHHERFGRVNVYQIRALKRYFTDAGYDWDEPA